MMYKIAKWLFKKYMRKLVIEFSGEICRDDYLSLMIIEIYFNNILERRTQLYADILCTVVDASCDMDAIRETETVINKFMEELEKLREKLETILSEIYFIIWSETLSNVGLKIMPLIVLCSLLRTLINVLGRI